jgi:hypothetical protein
MHRYEVYIGSSQKPVVVIADSSESRYMDGAPGVFVKFKDGNGNTIASFHLTSGGWSMIQ